MSDSDEIEVLLKNLNIHESSFANLRRGLASIRRLPFLVPHAQVNAVDSILGYLDRGMNVVLEFGRHRDYNSIHAGGQYARPPDLPALPGKKPKLLWPVKFTPPTPLVITIEEAHKFLNHEIANQTIFGEIAREMRKYKCHTPGDRPAAQRHPMRKSCRSWAPKITCLLDNEKDIEAVLAGVSG